MESSVTDPVQGPGCEAADGAGQDHQRRACPQAGNPHGLARGDREAPEWSPTLALHLPGVPEGWAQDGRHRLREPREDPLQGRRGGSGTVPD
eukprot:7025438-Heterocapsa_arctica.AAC.1